jgi:hypothetical protein
MQAVSTSEVILGDLVVNVLAIESQTRAFKRGREQWILTAIKIRSMPSFGGKVKPEAPCKKISLNYEQR